MNPSRGRLLLAASAATLFWTMPLSIVAAQPSPAPAPPAAATRPEAPKAAASSDAAADAAMAPTIDAASAESDRWLGLIDHGKFDESWMAAAVVLQEAVPQKDWSVDLAARAPKLGRMIMRERKSGTYSRTLRGAPTGDYVIVTYLTKFEKVPLVEETLAVAKDAIGQWHVAGYDIALSSVKAP